MERPILFSAPMVRAILDGRKTQTRRIIKPAHLPFVENLRDNFLSGDWGKRPLPYGECGDHLWVREAWKLQDIGDCGGHVVYPADGAIIEIGPQPLSRPIFNKTGNKPSIHMTRDISRISLEITGVRVERLQEITEEDAVAEGIEPFNDFGGQFWRRYNDGGLNGYVDSPISSYASLWTEINGDGSWEANPFVWAVSFRRIHTAEMAVAA